MKGYLEAEAVIFEKAYEQYEKTVETDKENRTECG